MISWQQEFGKKQSIEFNNGSGIPVYARRRIDFDKMMEMDEEHRLSSEEPGTRFGLEFTTQGLGRLCDLVTFGDLKRLREVCKSWNDLVSNHPRFRFANCTLAMDWEVKCETMAMSNMKFWQNLTLDRMSLKRNLFFNAYWAQASARIKILELKHVRGSCQTVGLLINKCSALESISLALTHFATEKVLVARGAQQGNPIRQDDINRNFQNLCCPHTDFDAGNFGICPQTIKSIMIGNNKSIPLCILDLLARRSEGKLEKIKFENNSAVENDNNLIQVIPAFPDVAQMQPYFERMFQNSIRTLREVKWDNNWKNGYGVFQTLAQREGEPMGLERISFGEIVKTPDRNRWRIGGDRDVQRNFVQPIHQFIHSQRSTLVELALSSKLYSELLVGLATSLPTMDHLQRFKLRFDRIDHDLTRDTNIFQNCPNLSEIEMTDFTYARYRDNRGWTRQISAYLSHLPLGIRKITFSHFLQPHDFRQIINSPTLLLLTKLEMRDNNRLVSDSVMQLIISRLTQLECLKIEYAYILTDAGLTGLDPVACQESDRCRSQSILLKEPLPLTILPENRSLQSLINMRELDFKECAGVTDVTLCYAVRFPELNTINLTGCNVSDIGIVSLGKHNPNLKSLIIKRNSSVSHFGLNRLLNISKSIKNVQTTQAVATPFCGSYVNDCYKENQFFKDIVIICPEKRRFDMN